MRLLRGRWGLLLGLAALIVLIDQVTKEWIIRDLALYESSEPIPALSDVFRFTHSTNTGAAFGILPNSGDLFLVLALGIVLALLYFYPRIPAAGLPTRVGVALVMGGALGNVIDRLRHGHVTDFIHYRIPDLISNVSNLADHAIVLGVIVIVLDSFRLERLEAQANTADDSASQADSTYNEDE